MKTIKKIFESVNIKTSKRTRDSSLVYFFTEKNNIEKKLPRLIVITNNDSTYNILDIKKGNIKKILKSDNEDIRFASFIEAILRFDYDSLSNIDVNFPEYKNDLYILHKNLPKSQLHNILATNYNMSHGNIKKYFGDIEDESENSYEIHGVEVYLPNFSKNYQLKYVDNIERVFRELKNKKLGFLLYGKVFIASLNQKVHGNYNISDDTVVIKRQKIGTEFSKTIFHEFAHRLIHVFLSDNKINSVRTEFQMLKNGFLDTEKKEKILSELKQGHKIKYLGNKDEVLKSERTVTIKENKTKLRELVIENSKDIYVVSYKNIDLRVWEFPSDINKSEIINFKKWFPTSYSYQNYEEWFCELFSYYMVGDVDDEVAKWMENIISQN